MVLLTFPSAYFITSTQSLSSPSSSIRHNFSCWLGTRLFNFRLLLSLFSQTLLIAFLHSTRLPQPNSRVRVCVNLLFSLSLSLSHCFFPPTLQPLRRVKAIFVDFPSVILGPFFRLPDYLEVTRFITIPEY